MNVTMEKENRMVRVIMDFVSYEKPTVVNVLRGLLSDYRNFNSVKFERDIITTEDARNRFYAEFYIRVGDVKRLNSLIRAKA